MLLVRPPQLIVGSRMLYISWEPSDPGAVAKLVPADLTPVKGRTVYMNQYVVDDASQLSNANSIETFGSYSLTYLGVELEGLDTEEGVPGRWWTHYLNSSSNMISYAQERGVPTSTGHTELELSGDRLVATTYDGDSAIIRTTCSVRLGKLVRANGQLRYVTRVNGDLMSGRYPFVADMAEEFSVKSLSFLDQSHPVYQMRPADPLTITFGFYSPSMSFCYPGGEGPLNTAPHGL